MTFCPPFAPLKIYRFLFPPQQTNVLSAASNASPTKIKSPALPAKTMYSEV